MAIAYEELVGSCSVKFTTGTGTSATRIFKVAWADVWTFAQEIYGRYRDPDLGGAYVEPAKFPYLDYLGVTDVNIEPMITDGITKLNNATGEYISYEYAVVTASYGVLLRAADGDPELVEEESISVAAEMTTVPDNDYKYAVAPMVVVENSAMPSKIESTTQFSITRYNVSSLPDATVASMVGTVNDATWRGYTAGKVLFVGSEARRAVTTEGAENWTVTYNFLLKEHSWNKIYRDSASAYQEVIKVTSGKKIYETSTLTDLGLAV